MVFQIGEQITEFEQNARAFCYFSARISERNELEIVCLRSESRINSESV